MVLAFTAPLTQDLTLFTRRMWQLRIPHRVLITDEAQDVLATTPEDALQLREFYFAWCDGQDLNHFSALADDADQTPKFSFRTFPVTLVLISLSLLLTLMIDFGGQRGVMQWFTIVDFQQTGNQVMYPSLDYTLSSGEWWRLLTPAFMHFNMPHILFNLLWVWVIGRQIERLHGSIWLAGIFAVSAIASNMAQFWVSGPFFGGMSGVVFALLGYAWLWDRFNKRLRIDLPPALMGFMLFWLALGFSGGLEVMGLGAIANTAHLVGLITGLAAGGLHSLLARRSKG